MLVLIQSIARDLFDVQDATLATKLSWLFEDDLDRNEFFMALEESLRIYFSDDGWDALSGLATIGDVVELLENKCFALVRRPRGMQNNDDT